MLYLLYLLNLVLMPPQVKHLVVGPLLPAEGLLALDRHLDLGVLLEGLLGVLVAPEEPLPRSL
jgi:hypothetical protein